MVAPGPYPLDVGCVPEKIGYTDRVLMPVALLARSPVYGCLPQ